MDFAKKPGEIRKRNGVKMELSEFFESLDGALLIRTYQDNVTHYLLVWKGGKHIWKYQLIENLVYCVDCKETHDGGAHERAKVSKFMDELMNK